MAGTKPTNNQTFFLFLLKQSDVLQKTVPSGFAEGTVLLVRGLSKRLLFLTSSGRMLTSKTLSLLEVNVRSVRAANQKPKYTGKNVKVY